ncbi:MAG: serine/threonine-protein phosphatase [Bacteroidaceae bacterium]|nr:serine/threonine-protein phosphatase [Bacteroidaceae bacterium]
MILNVNAICSRGTVRENNEDLVTLGGIMLRDGKFSEEVEFTGAPAYYLLIADGMGGHEKGEQASFMTLEHLRDCFSMGDLEAETFADDITRSVQYISYKINAIARYEKHEHPMGCTLTGVVWLGNRAWLVNAGDSRTYLFRDGIVEQLTMDEENEDGLLTNCVGGGSDTTLAVTEITGKLQEGDTILICSDGLADVVNDDYLEYFLMNSLSPAEELAEWAMENGSTDNVSVIAARVGGGEFGDPAEGPDDDGRFDAWV